MRTPATSRAGTGSEMTVSRHARRRAARCSSAAATAQLTQKHRINFSHEYQTRCEGAPLRQETEGGCHNRGTSWIASAGATTSPEAATSYIDFPYYLTQALWTAPMTNKILLEAGYSRLSYEPRGGPGPVAAGRDFQYRCHGAVDDGGPGARIHQPGTARQLRLSWAVAVPRTTGATRTTGARRRHT
jgi:hypothetical protein